MLHPQKARFFDPRSTASTAWSASKITRIEFSTDTDGATRIRVGTESELGPSRAMESGVLQWVQSESQTIAWKLPGESVISVAAFTQPEEYRLAIDDFIVGATVYGPRGAMDCAFCQDPECNYYAQQIRARRDACPTCGVRRLEQTALEPLALYAYERVSRQRYLRIRGKDNKRIRRPEWHDEIAHLLLAICRAGNDLVSAIKEWARARNGLPLQECRAVLDTLSEKKRWLSGEHEALFVIAMERMERARDDISSVTGQADSGTSEQ